MSAPADLAAYLDSLGIGSLTSVPPTLYKGSRPSDPDTLLCIYQYPGNAPEYVQESTSPAWESPQIQVLARSRDYEEAALLAQRAWTALASLTNAVLSGTKYRSVRPIGSPGTLGRDANDRLLIAFNATVVKEAELVVSS